MTMPSQLPTPEPPAHEETPDEQGDSQGFTICMDVKPNSFRVRKEPLEEESQEPAQPGQPPQELGQEFTKLEDALKAQVSMVKQSPLTGGEQAGFEAGNNAERQSMGNPA